MGGLSSSRSSFETALLCSRACPIGVLNSMNNPAGSEFSSTHVVNLVSSPDSHKDEVCDDALGGSQLRVSALASSLDPNPDQHPPPISCAEGSHDDPEADSMENNPQAGLSSLILLSTSADVYKGEGSTSCNLPNSTPQFSPAQSLSPLPEHLAFTFADLTNVPASEPRTGAEFQLSSPSGEAGCRSSYNRDDLLNPVRVGLIDKWGLSSPGTDSAITAGPVADELGLMVLVSPQSTPASEVMLSMVNSSSDMATSGDEVDMPPVEHGKSERKVSELEQKLLEEGELEDGELSGGWESGEDDEADNADLMICSDDRHEEHEVDEHEEEDEEGIIDYRTEGLTPVVMRYGMDGTINQATIRGGTVSPLGKKNSKRRKGKGALSRQRKKSRLEKVQKGSNEPITEVNADARQHGDYLAIGLKKKVDSTNTGRKAGEKQQVPGGKRVEADTGPEEGEVVEEDNRGLLSQLVEEEVGLWTTDVGDDQITSSKIDSDEDAKKKTRAPISAERKLKKKVAFRRKRAEKEKELGIRRPRMPANTFKPKVPLCKFYMKGRCSLGAKCTFSHDVVPVTKSDPCKFFMVNRCLKGDDCPFSHTLDTFPCKFWHTRGHCLDGSNCRFSHGPLTDNQRLNLAKRIEHDCKELQNVPDIPTEFNTQEDSESEYMPTMNSSRTEALGWDVNPPQSLNPDTVSYASTSMASHSLHYSREVPPAAPRSNFSPNQTSWFGEMNREEIQLTETYKEETPVENAVLLAARKAASAAAVQAAGTTDKLLGFSRSSPSISLPKSRSFGRLVGRGSEASAMDLLQASFSSDDRSESSRDDGSGPVSNKGTLSALAVGSPGGDGMFSERLLAGSPLSRITSPSLARGSSLGHTKQAAVQGSKASAMELLQASLGNDATMEGREARDIVTS